jgi:hypothetical protein
MQSQNHQNSEVSTTKPSLNHRIYSLTLSMLGWTFLFWIIYTIIYQFIDGWHWSAISNTEKALDKLTVLIWELGYIVMCCCWVNKIHNIIISSK